MSNFAVAASDEVIRKGNELLEKVAGPGDKKADALDRVFDMAYSLLDDETMKHGGVDVEALDASLASIRSQYLALVDGREQIIAKKDALLREEKDARAKQEAELRNRIEEADSAQKTAEKAAQDASETAERAVREAAAAKDQASSSARLAEEKDNRIHTLEGLLAAAEKKASDCETLQKDKSNAEAKIQVLTLQIRDLQKEHDQQIRDLNKDRETQIRELSTEMDRRVSDARKDALLAQEKALAAQERELNAGFQEQLREADKTTSRLQVIIEGLQEQLARMKPDAGDGNGH